MTQKRINTGTSPNKGDGDPLRTAFGKINDNFDELYATDTATKYHMGDDVQFVNVELDGDGVPTGMITVQSGFDTSMPVYIKGANAMRNGTGGNVIIEAGAPPLAAPEQLIQGGGPYDGTVGDIEIAGNQTTIDSLGNVWTFHKDGTTHFPNYTFPATHGAAGQTLVDNGTGVLSWSTPSGGGISISDFGDGFSLTAADKIVTNKLYSTNATQPTQHYRLELDTNGVVVLPDGSIINGSTIRGVAGTGELNYTGITIGPDTNHREESWMYVDHTGSYIATQYNTNQKLWQFKNDGSTILPSGAGFVKGDSGQLKVNDSTTLALDLRDSSGRGFYTNGDGFSLRGNGSNTWTFGTNGSLTLPGGSAIGYTPSVSTDITVNNKKWAFDVNGTLTVPGNISAEVGKNLSIKTKSVTDIAIEFAGSGYPSLGGLFATTGGSGTGMTVQVYGPSGSLEAVSIGNPGSGYLDGDVVNVVGGNGTVRVRITQGNWTFGTDGDLVLPAGKTIRDPSGTDLLAGGSGGSTLLEPYKGFRAHYGSMYDNNNDPNGPINKLVIYKSTVAPASAIDTSTNRDDFQVTGLTGSDVVAMLVVVSDNITQTSLVDLKTFVEAVIDEVILTGGVEGNVNSISDMKLAFYNNFNNFNTIIPSVKTNFEFFDNGNWPTDNMYDGGDDEYDVGNYINTNITNGLSYNNGDIVSSSSDVGGGDYVVTYQDGIFGFFATNANFNTIGTSGSDGYGNGDGSGFDGYGIAVTGSLYSAPAVTISEITNTDGSSIYSVSVGTDGMITFPRGGLDPYGGNSPTLWAAVDQDFYIKTTRTDPGNDADIELWAADDLRLWAGSGIEIYTNNVNGDTKDWYFGADGETWFPDNTILTNRQPLSISSGNTKFFGYVDLITTPGIVYTGTNLEPSVSAEIKFNTDGTYSVLGWSSGQGFAQGETFFIPGTVFNGASPANDCTLTITQVDINGSVGGWSAVGTHPDVTKTWTFDTDAGTLTLPDNNKITAPLNSPVSVQTSYTVTTTYSGSYNGYATGSDTWGINVDNFTGIENVQIGWTVNIQPDNLTYIITAVQTYPGGCYFYGSGTAPAVLGTYTLTGPATIANTWAFGTNGILTLPLGGDIVDSIGTSVLGGGATLPSQTDNNGKYLTTDGSALSWGTVAGGIPLTGATFNLDPNAGLTINTTDGAIHLMRNGVTGVQIESDGVKLYASNLPVIWDGSVLKLPYGADVQRDISGNGPYVSVLNASNGTVVSRSTALISTASIAANVTDTVSIPAFKGYVLYKITTSAAAWVRLYSDVASRTADLATERPQTSDPSTDGVIAETVTTGADVVLITPGVYGFNNEYPLTSNIAAAITNLSGTTRSITVTLDILQTEA
jgi:hypothetical protein